uniref:Uncharacterized protein n=1 Tax=Medicago truncatula TaxID=3880 RepID=A2Q5H7_MEDTR|nr:hypothetical protein MtrDRAFT_AC161399g11v2 [Medicago truncatula]
MPSLGKCLTIEVNWQKPIVGWKKSTLMELQLVIIVELRLVLSSRTEATFVTCFSMNIGNQKLYMQNLVQLSMLSRKQR